MSRALAWLAFGFAWIFIMALTIPARAHDHWINRMQLTDPVTGAWCCNELDCAEVPASGIRESPAGVVVLETGETIAYPRVIWKSPDGTWMRCRNLSNNSTRCLIGPPRGF